MVANVAATSLTCLLSDCQPSLTEIKQNHIHVKSTITGIIQRTCVELHGEASYLLHQSCHLQSLVEVQLHS